MSRRKFLIYGGSGYIGSAIVRRLAAMGNTIVATYNSHKPSIEVDEVTWLRCDITDENALNGLRSSLEDNFSHIDGVAIACGPDFGNIHSRHEVDRLFQHVETIDGSRFKSIVDFHSLGFYRAALAALELLKKGRNPNIVMMGSLVGIKAVFLPAHFASAKATVRGLVASLAKGLGKDNIKVNSIDPGILAGGASDFLPDWLKDDYLKHCSLRRFGTAEEIAEVVCWMLSENTYITGKSILLDGGL